MLIPRTFKDITRIPMVFHREFWVFFLGLFLEFARCKFPIISKISNTKSLGILREFSLMKNSKEFPRIFLSNSLFRKTLGKTLGNSLALGNHGDFSLKIPCFKILVINTLVFLHDSKPACWWPYLQKFSLNLFFL